MHLYSRTKSKKAKLEKVEIFESEALKYIYICCDKKYRWIVCFLNDP